MRRLSNEERQQANREGAEALELFQLGFKEGDATRKMVENLLEQVDSRERPRSVHSTSGKSEK